MDWVGGRKFGDEAMNKATRKMLSASDLDLVLATEPAALRSLDEDALVDLHRRVRRARNKYSKLYRRRANAQVGANQARAGASKTHRRTAPRAKRSEIDR